MTGTQLAALIRKNTRTNSTTYSDADLLVDVNIAKDILASRIQRIRRDIWQIPFTDNLVADQREYAFPADVMNSINTVELQFTAGGDYVLATPYKRRHYRESLLESNITNAFDNENPRYFIRRKSIYILSGTIVAVTNGIQVVADIFPADLANLTGSTDLSVDPSTTTHGFPREFHELWARYVSMTYKQRNEMPLGPMELNFEVDFERTMNEFNRPMTEEELLTTFPHSDIRDKY